MKNLAASEAKGAVRPIAGRPEKYIHWPIIYAHSQERQVHIFEVFTNPAAWNS